MAYGFDLRPPVARASLSLSAGIARRKKEEPMRYVPALALGLAILVGCAVAPDPAPVAPTTTAPAPVALQEDDPGWDCQTMGNEQCGPEVTR